MLKNWRKKIDDNPIKFGNFNIKCKSKTKYLDQILCKKLSTNALETVKEKENKIKAATYEIKKIIEDFKMQRLSG